MKRNFLSVCILVSLLTPAFAQNWVEQGDQFARWGALKEARLAYDQAEASSLSAAELRPLYFRQLSLAQVVGDEREAEKTLAKLSSGPMDRESEIRSASARATFAYFAGRHRIANQEFDKVLSLTSGGATEPYAIVARFAAESFKYKQRVDADGWPGADEVAKEVTRVLTPLGSLPHTKLHEPLLLTKAHPWIELWIKDTLQRIEANPATGQKELNNLSFVVGLMQLSLGDRFAKLRDPEAGGLAIQYPLDMAEGLAEFSPQEANKWIRQVEFFLKLGQDQIQKANLGVEISGTGLNYFEARLASVRAKVRMKQGQIGPALSDLKSATEKFQKAGLEGAHLWSLIHYAQALLEYGGPQQKQAAQQAVSHASELNKNLGQKRAQILLVLLASKLQPNNSEAAAALMRKGVELLEAEAPYLSPSTENSNLISETYDPLVTYLVQSGQAEEAMELEVRRTALRQASEKKIGEIRSNDPIVQQALASAASSQAKARKLEAQLQAAELMDQPKERAKLEKEVAENRGDFLQALNRISQANPGYASLVAIRPTNFARLQSQLPPGALLLQYCQTDTQLYIFTASATELSIKTVPVSRDKLKSTILTARRELIRARGKVEALRALYSLLITPVQKEVDKASVLIVAPTEGLYFLPFAALVTKDGDRDSYLIEQKSLVTVTSTEMLLDAGSDEKKLEGVVILGYPDGSLPSAREEATEVGKLFSQSKIYLASDATSKAIRNLEPNTSLVHLATHAITNPQDVNSSYLVLAHDGKDNKLTLGEIYGLNFDGVSLVTLSACGTAMGQREPTWSVASLAQAFHLAGAGTLVASLWNVDDDSTRDLMLAFYRNLKQGKPKAEAMRAAQMQLIKSQKHFDPYFWSGFTIIGDWR